MYHFISGYTAKGRRNRRKASEPSPCSAPITDAFHAVASAPDMRSCWASASQPQGERLVGEYRLDRWPWRWQRRIGIHIPGAMVKCRPGWSVNDVPVWEDPVFGLTCRSPVPMCGRSAARDGWQDKAMRRSGRRNWPGCFTTTSRSIRRPGAGVVAAAPDRGRAAATRCPDRGARGDRPQNGHYPPFDRGWGRFCGRAFPLHLAVLLHLPVWITQPGGDGARFR